MGLMYCVRKNCDTIMCETYVDGIGYVCSQCQIEFKRYLGKYGIVLNNNNEILMELEKFMKTDKEEIILDGNLIDDFFKNYTKE